ncbi:hypothetical protein ACFW04_002395 [Cataglyphis niger]
MEPLNCLPFGFSSDEAGWWSTKCWSWSRINVRTQ